MNQPSKYLTYTEADFTRDPLFRSWVLAPDEVNRAFWQQWLDQHPEKERVLENARWQMLQLTVAEEAGVEARLDAVWQGIQRRKAALEAVAETHPAAALPAAGGQVRSLFSLAAWQRVAAILVLVSFCAGALYYYGRPQAVPPRVFATAYGQTRWLQLPDGSEVVLNGNSRLAFAPDWRQGDDRQVWLQGEAFFSVRHTPDHRRFQVNLKDNLQVTVLGTAFTVTQRPAKTQVVLNQGRVKLSQTAQRYYGLQTLVRRQALLAPGDLVEVTGKDARFRKTKVAQPERYAAFTQQKIIFNNTALAEVARVLTDTYGYRIIFARPGLEEKHFSGTTPTADIDMLFSVIGKLFQVQVIREGKNIILK